MRQSTHEDQRDFFSALAPKRERDATKQKTYYEDRRRWLTRLLPKDASIIEVGCGTGLSLANLPQTKKTGLDFSPAMIAVATVRDPKSTYIVDDLLTLQHRSSYDYVLLLDTINFVSDVEIALINIRSCLCHEHTRIVITYYNFLWQPLFLFAEFLGWKTRFPEQNWLRRTDIVNLLQLTGYEVVQTGERILCPIGIPLLATFCNRYLVSLPFFRLFALVKDVIARPVYHERQEKSVSIISAVRNERGNIRPIIEAMPELGTHTELIFIEGHSTDGTWEEIQRAMAEYRGPLTIKGIKQTGKGKANALHEGIAESHGELLFIYDGDFTVHPSELTKMYDGFATGRAEFINTSRLIYPLEEGSMRILNLIGNKTFSMLFSWLFSQNLSDVLSPVKALQKRDYSAVETRLDPFGDFDFFLGAGSKQLKMREVPVHYLERTYGTTKIRRFHHGWLLLKMCLFGAKKLKWI